MRHLGQVGDDIAALNIFTHADGHGMRALVRRGAAQHITESDNLAVGVRNLDTDGALARNRREDAHLIGCHRIREVFRQRGDALNFDPRAEFDFVAGDGRTAIESRDLGVDVELIEHLGD